MTREINGKTTRTETETNPMPSLKETFHPPMPQWQRFSILIVASWVATMVLARSIDRVKAR